MTHYVGTSGFQYRAWRGHFYPDGCREADMLARYGTRLCSVEVNNTFYRMPKTEVLARWRDTVPAHFRFAVKASQRITHRKRLVDCAEPLEYLLGNLAVLGATCGPLLFQLPPNARRNDERLAAFLKLLPDTMRAAFEFRHDSWFDETVFGLLREHNVALCVADVDDLDAAVLDARFVTTADYGYLRLRRDGYTGEALAAQATRIAAAGFRDSYVYFKHEEAGPHLAEKLVALLSPG